jgi:undecaprenyl-diphosphatase
MEGGRMSGFFQFLIRLDRSVFHSFNSIAGKNSVVDWFARSGADDHIVPLILTLLVLATLLWAGKHAGREVALKTVICATISAVVSMLVLYGLNNIFFRPRPFTTQVVHLLFYHNTDSSFPSNAATLAFALAFAVFLYWRKLGWVMLGLATFQGLARIVVGIHYPIDIIGGALLGLGAALAARAAEPLYGPLARWLNAGLDRLLASWKRPQRVEPERSGSK